LKKIIASLAAGLILVTATFAFADSQIKLFVNGKEIQSEVSPQIVDGQVLVPAQPLAKALGVRFQWSAERNIVSITTDDVNHSKPIPIDRKEFLDTIKEELENMEQNNEPPTAEDEGNSEKNYSDIRIAQCGISVKRDYEVEDATYEGLKAITVNNQVYFDIADYKGKAYAAQKDCYYHYTSEKNVFEYILNGVVFKEIPVNESNVQIIDRGNRYICTYINTDFYEDF